MTDNKEKQEKNRLAVLFGDVLKDLRKSPKRSAKEVATDLSLNDATYRVFESGFTVIPPTYTSKLVAIFPTLNWSRVAQFLVAVQLIEKAKKHEKRQVLEELASRSPSDCGFWRSLIGEYQLNDAPSSGNDDRMKRISELKNFLMRPDNPPASPASNSRINRFQAATQRLSPYYFDVISSQLAALAHFPPRTTPELLRQWEQQNAHRFKGIYGIMRSSDLLVSEVGNFGWDYIYNDDFSGLYLLTFADPQLTKLHTRSLHQKLVDTRPRQYRDERAAEKIVKQKVILKSIHACGLDEQRKIKSLLRFSVTTGELLELAPADSTVLELQNAWLYHMKDTGNVVAFVDDKGPLPSHPYQAAVLSWSATDSLLKVLERIWPSQALNLSGE